MPNLRKPNLVCPHENCEHQLTKGELYDRDSDSFEEFVDDMVCPECRKDFHPEDGLLEYYSNVPINEIAYHSFSIGGYCNQGTINIEPGRTEEESIITNIEMTVNVDGEEAFSGSTQHDLDLGIPYVWDPEDRDFDDVVGDTVDPASGPVLLFDDRVVADITEVSDPDGPLKLAFTTSLRENVDVDEVTIGYHFDAYLSNVQGPSWIELLREAIKIIHDGTGRAPYPLMITAFDNLILRQINRTARSHGWSEARIDSYLEDMRWKNWVKDGLEEFTGERLTERDITLYQEFDSVRNRRNTEIVHLSHDDVLPSISPSVAMDDFKTVLKSMIEVYKMCFETRQELIND